MSLVLCPVQKSPCTAAAVSKRQERARRLFTQTTTFLSFLHSELTRTPLPWLMVASLRLRAMSAFLAAAPDITKLKRLKGTIEAPVLVDLAAKKEAKKVGSAKTHPKVVDIAATTPPLTPASPSTLAAAAAASPSTAVSLSLTECTDLAALLRDLESLQESRDLWRSASSMESSIESKARKGVLAEADLSLLSGAEQLNCEHMESNTPESCIRYLKRFIPAAIKLYAIPPFVHDTATLGLSLTI
jgi:hypothetical protein